MSSLINVHGGPPLLPPLSTAQTQSRRCKKSTEILRHRKGKTLSLATIFPSPEVGDKTELANTPSPMGLCSPSILDPVPDSLPKDAKGPTFPETPEPSP